MKTTIYSVILMLSIAGSLFAQNNIVEINYSRPPLNSLKSADLWSVRITNSGEPFTAYLFGSMTNNENGELIATGQTMTFEVKRGTTNFKVSDLPSVPNINYLSKDPKYKQSFVNTGGAPHGDYKICISLKRTNNEVTAEDCIDQKITGGDAPQLIAPGNDSELEIENPVFTWMHIKSPGSNQTYSLKIVELKGGESPENAMLRNKAFFEKEGIQTQMFQYPTSAPQFEDGKNYAWMVSVGNVNSEARMFMGPSSGIVYTGKPKTEVIETVEGWEFINVNFTPDELKTLLAIYGHKENDYKLLTVKNNIVTQSYGNADISKVRIVGNEEEDNSPQIRSWMIIDMSKKIVLLTHLNDIDKEKVKEIMRKYVTKEENQKLK